MCSIGLHRALVEGSDGSAMFFSASDVLGRVGSKLNKSDFGSRFYVRIPRPLGNPTGDMHLSPVFLPHHPSPNVMARASLRSTHVVSCHRLSSRAS